MAKTLSRSLHRNDNETAELRNCVTVNETAQLWKYTAPVGTFSARGVSNDPIP